jgi:hypothetical protein
MDNWHRRDDRACETGTMSETPRPVVAAFDLDGSLTEGGSVWHWLRYNRGLGRRVSCGLATHSCPWSWAPIRSGAWADHAKERLFKKLTRRYATSRTCVTNRARSPSPTSRSADVAKVHRTSCAGTRPRVTTSSIVSASPQIYVDVIVEALAGDRGARHATRRGPARTV